MAVNFENHLPLGALDIVTTGQTSVWGCLTFTVEARNVKFIDAVDPKNPPDPKNVNAWCYIRSGSPQERAATLENYLGPVINVQRGQPLKTVWINKLPSMGAANPGEARPLAVPPINPADMEIGNSIPQFKSMNYALGIATHLHGGKVLPTSDGWPLHPASYEGNPFDMPSHRTYFYPNDQRATMLWFHDHSMDNTAQQVHAGLAGLYFIRDHSDAEIFHLIGGEAQEIPLVIQDRCFASKGQDGLETDYTRIDYQKGVPLLRTKTLGDRPEFLGDTIFVNGRPWPHVHADRKIYRLRVLNGSNARTYALTLADPAGTDNGKVWYGDRLTAIGNEAGLLGKSVTLQDKQYLLLAPGERLDLLVDFTGVKPEVNALILVNLALAGYDPGAPDAEPIFQFDENSVMPPDSDKALGAIGAANQPKPGPYLPLANLLQFRFAAAGHVHGGGGHSEPLALDVDTLDKILRRHADDESFHWVPGASPELVPSPANAPIAHNRFVVLMNDTRKLAQNGENSPYTGDTPWRDTQIWELRPSTAPSGDPTAFPVPFDARLNNPTQQGAPASAVPYQVARAFFFEPEEPMPPHAPTHKDALWGLATQNSNPAGFPPIYRYPHLYRINPAQGRQVIQPVEGTYERWYVANIGNDPTNLAGGAPDMHPFHLHLVNFVVTRRWALNSANQFVETTGNRPLDFDRVARHDTVRIQSNELVELLVHFPKGYTGHYPYHCHLVEHEDMGMMLHFDVQARQGACGA